MAFKDDLNSKPFIGWTDGFKVNNPTVLDLDSIKKTYEELSNWANNVNSSCVPGRIVSVIGDNTADKNGVYVVGTVKRETGKDAIIIKISNLTTENTGLIKVVNGASLPDEPASGDSDKIHLLKSSETGGNEYDEYVYIIGTGWEKIGSISVNTDISLDNYYTSTQINTIITELEERIGNNIDTVDSKIDEVVSDMETIIGSSEDAAEKFKAQFDTNTNNITTLLESISNLSLAEYNEEDFSLALNFRISGNEDETTTTTTLSPSTTTSQPN